MILRAQRTPRFAGFRRGPPVSATRRNRAEANARGILGKNVLRADQMIAADVSPQRRDLFQQQLKIKCVEDNADAARDAKMLLLSVKPQHMAAALAPIGAVISEHTLII